MAAVEKSKVVFERPNPYGWLTVIFPHVTEDMNIEMWLRDALEWVRLNNIRRFTWTFVHGSKKDSERVSPVFFFKDEMEAMGCVWRFKGELLHQTAR